MTKNFRFGKEFRLRSSQDFSYLKGGSFQMKTSSLKVYYRPSRVDLEFTRIAFSVSRKVGKSFVRNRIKRVLREFFRQSNYKFLNYDILFVVHQKSLQREKKLLDDFSYLLKQINVKSSTIKEK